MIVGSRQEFYQDLADNTDSRLFLVGDRQCIKFPYHLSADAVKLAEGDVFCAYEADTAFLPFAVQGIGGPLTAS